MRCVVRAMPAAWSPIRSRFSVREKPPLAVAQRGGLLAHPPDERAHQALAEGVERPGAPHDGEGAAGSAPDGPTTPRPAAPTPPQPRRRGGDVVRASGPRAAPRAATCRASPPIRSDDVATRIEPGGILRSQAIGRRSAGAAVARSAGLRSSASRARAGLRRPGVASLGRAEGGGRQLPRPCGRSASRPRGDPPRRPRRRAAPPSPAGVGSGPAAANGRRTPPTSS